MAELIEFYYVRAKTKRGGRSPKQFPSTISFDVKIVKNKNKMKNTKTRTMLPWPDRRVACPVHHAFHHVETQRSTKRTFIKPVPFHSSRHLLRSLKRTRPLSTMSPYKLVKLCEYIPLSLFRALFPLSPGVRYSDPTRESKNTSIYQSFRLLSSLIRTGSATKQAKQRTIHTKRARD